MTKQSPISVLCCLQLIAFTLPTIASESQNVTPAQQALRHCNHYYRGYLWKVFSSEYYHGAPCTGFDDNARTFRIDDSLDNSAQMVQTAIKSAAEGLEVYVTFDGCKDAIVALSNSPDPIQTYIYK